MKWKVLAILNFHVDPMYHNKIQFSSTRGSTAILIMKWKVLAILNFHVDPMYHNKIQLSSTLGSTAILIMKWKVLAILNFHLAPMYPTKIQYSLTRGSTAIFDNSMEDFIKSEFLFFSDVSYKDSVLFDMWFDGLI